MTAPKPDPSQRRRRAITAALLILFMATMAAIEALVEREGSWRLIDYVRLSAILLLAVVISLRATTNFSLRRRRPELDDELTRANRASAAAWGYWAFFFGIVAAFGVSFAWPAFQIELLTPAMLAFGAAVAGLRFVTLERRGE